MRTGEYEIVIEDDAGEEMGSLIRTDVSGRPAVGDEIAIEGSVFVVHKVRHHEDDERYRCTTRTYTTPTCYVRASRVP